jgi:hypothetical protein
MDELTGLIAVGTGWVAILMPVLLLGVIFYFTTKSEKAKYQAMVDISKNLENESDIKDLLENFNEKKKPMDYRRNGVITMFIGLGLFIFGLVNIPILKGVGLLIICIGFGSLVAGYIYPNESEEIDKSVQRFEER